MSVEKSVNLKAQISLLENVPGVYQFYEESGNLLYVGKAKKLKNQWNYSYSGIGNPIPVLGSESTSSVSFLKDVLEDSTEGSLLNSYAYSNPSYSTALRTKIYASLEYTVDHNNFVSLSLYSSFVRGKWRRGLGLAYNYHLGHNFAATASYSIYNRSYSNVGLGITVNFGS